MPAPIATDMHQLITTKFGSFKLKIPVDWKGAITELHYKQFAFKDGHLFTSPNIPGIPVHFGAGALNKYHTEAQKFIISKVQNFMKHTTEHLCKSWGNWHQTATIMS